MERSLPVSASDVESVEIKLSDGEFDTNMCNERAEYAFHVACASGSSELTKRLLEGGARAGPMPLFLASQYGHLECVKLLLTDSAEFVNYRNHNQSCVGLASKNGHWSVVELLLDFGADLVDLDLKSPAFWKHEHSKLIVKLIRADLQKQPPETSSLMRALIHGNESLAVQLLLDDRLNLGDHLSMMMHYSAKQNWCEMIRRLLVDRRFDVNDGSYFGTTPLRAACKRGRMSAVVLLLQNGADPNVVTVTDRGLPYPIQVAAAKGYEDIVEILMHHGARFKTLTPSPVHLAIGAGNMEIVKMLVDAGCDVNAPDSRGITALLKAAFSCQLRTLTELVRLGAEVSCKSVANETVLHFLLFGYIKRKREASEIALPSTNQAKDSSTSVITTPPDDGEILDAVNFLLKNGADCHALAINGDTPLTAACVAGLDKVVAVLLDSGCDVNAGDAFYYPLVIACDGSNDVIVEQLLVAGAHADGPRESDAVGVECARQRVSELRNDDGIKYTRRRCLKLERTTPLSLAIKNCSSRIVDLLIKHGADVNLEVRRGKRPFEYAVDHLLWNKDSSWKREQLKEILRLLLRSNADVSTLPNSVSFLHRVCSHGLSDVAEMLLKHGVDPNEACRSSSSGCGRSTPLRAACVSGNEHLVKLLLLHGALPTEPALNAGNRPRTLDRWNDKEPLLHVASAKGLDRMASLLLEHGAVVDSVNSYGETALHLAATAAVVKVLLEKGGVDVNRENISGKTPLFKACKNGRADVVEELLKNGAEVKGGHFSRNPLSFACDRADLDVIKLLLSYNANYIKETEKQCTVSTFLTSAAVSCDKAIVDELLRHGASTNATDRRLRTPLFVALETWESVMDSRCSDAKDDGVPVEQVDPPRHDDDAYKTFLEVIDTLLANGADPNASVNNRGTPLIYAVENGMYDVVCKLIEHGADINLFSAGKYPITAIWGSIEDDYCITAPGFKRNLLKILDLLLSRSVNLNVVHSKSGESPLYMALRNEMLETAEGMIKADADTNLTTSKQYPLILACSKGWHDIVESLLDAGADPNARDHVGMTPLCASSEKAAEAITSLLISKNANASATDDNGGTPLHYLLKNVPPARDRNCIGRLVDLLLMSGASVNALNDFGETPLYLACFKNDDDLELIEMLLNRGADANLQLETSKLRPDLHIGDDNYGNLPLFVAVSRSNHKLFELLLDRGANIHQTDSSGQSVVHRAVSYSCSTSGCPEIVSMLLSVLSSCANVDVTCKNGKTALYVACETCYDDENKKLKVVGILLDHGADVNKTTAGHAKIPLAAACRAQDIELAKFLLLKGAKANVSVASGPARNNNHVNSVQYASDLCVPLCVAVYHGNQALAGLLLEHGADVNLRDVGGSTALHIALDRSNNCIGSIYDDDCLLLLPLLLSNGADFNVTNDNGQTALYQACRHHNFFKVQRAVKTMLDCGKLVNQDTPYQPLLAAVRDDNDSLVELLLAHGADPDVSARDPSRGKPLDKCVALPLCVAAANGNVEIVQRLLAAGAGTNSIDGCGRAAIHYVVERYKEWSDGVYKGELWHSVEYWRRYDAVADRLLQAGSDLNLMDPESKSRPFGVVKETLVSQWSTDWDESITARRAIFRMFDKLVANGAAIDDSDDDEYAGIGEFVHVRHVDYKWVVKLFKAGVPDLLLVKCCRGMTSGAWQTDCLALAQAVALNRFQVDTSVVDKSKFEWDSEIEEHRKFEAWLKEDMQQPRSLLRLCRVVVRKQLYVAAGCRTIVPSIERLPLPPQMLQYLVFEGVRSEVDLSLSDDDDETYESSGLYSDDTSTDDYDYDDDDDDDDDNYRPFPVRRRANQKEPEEVVSSASDDSDDDDIRCADKEELDEAVPPDTDDNDDDDDNEQGGDDDYDELLPSSSEDGTDQ